MSENKEKPAPKETVTEWENGKLVEKELDDGVAFDVLARARPKPVVRQASPFQKAPRVGKKRGPDTKKRRQQYRKIVGAILAEGDLPTTIAGLARKVHVKRRQKKLTTADSHKAEEWTIRDILERHKGK